MCAQSDLTLCNPMDCSLPGFCVHGILQARILEWVALPFSRGSSQPRDRMWVSLIAGWFLTLWATKDANLSMCYAVLSHSVMSDLTISLHIKNWNSWIWPLFSWKGKFLFLWASVMSHILTLKRVDSICVFEQFLLIFWGELLHGKDFLARMS